MEPSAEARRDRETGTNAAWDLTGAELGGNSVFTVCFGTSHDGIHFLSVCSAKRVKS